MGVRIERNMASITAKITAGKEMMIPALTEAVIQYGNIFVREDQGVLMASSLIGTTVKDTVSRSNWSASDRQTYSSASGSKPKEGLAIWDTPYAKRVYYTGKPSKDKNPDASLMWAQKAVDTYSKELAQIAQKNFSEGMGKV